MKRRGAKKFFLKKMNEISVGKQPNGYTAVLKNNMTYTGYFVCQNIN